MASNRNSICDIWSHKTINSDREIVNSTLGPAVYFLFRRQPHFISNFAHLSRKGPIGPKSLQSFAISARCGRFLRDGNENIKLTATAQNSLWSKMEWDCKKSNILVANICEENAKYIFLEKVVQYIFFENTEEHFFGKRDIYFFVGKYPSISSLVSPSRLAKCLELHQDQEPIFFFVEKIKSLI